MTQWAHVLGMCPADAQRRWASALTGAAQSLWDERCAADIHSALQYFCGLLPQWPPLGAATDAAIGSFTAVLALRPPAPPAVINGIALAILSLCQHHGSSLSQPVASVALRELLALRSAHTHEVLEGRHGLHAAVVSTLDLAAKTMIRGVVIEDFAIVEWMAGRLVPIGAREGHIEATLRGEQQLALFLVPRLAASPVVQPAHHAAIAVALSVMMSEIPFYGQSVACSVQQYCTHFQPPSAATPPAAVEARAGPLSAADVRVALQQREVVAQAELTDLSDLLAKEAHVHTALVRQMNDASEAGAALEQGIRGEINRLLGGNASDSAVSNLMALLFRGSVGRDCLADVTNADEDPKWRRPPQLRR